MIPTAFSWFSILTVEVAIDKILKSLRQGVYHVQRSGSGWGWCSCWGMQTVYSYGLPAVELWLLKTVCNFKSAIHLGITCSGMRSVMFIWAIVVQMDCTRNQYAFMTLFHGICFTEEDQILVDNAIDPTGHSKRRIVIIQESCIIGIL